MFTRGTTITVPEISAGLSHWSTPSSAIIEAYSVPCAPVTNASTGPGFAPCTTTTGILVAASTPAGTSMKPVAFCPGAALAVPTVKFFSCARSVEAQRPAASVSVIAINRRMRYPPHRCGLIRARVYPHFVIPGRAAQNRRLAGFRPIIGKCGSNTPVRLDY